jgi:hypothetical protein
MKVILAISTAREEAERLLTLLREVGTIVVSDLEVMDELIKIMTPADVMAVRYHRGNLPPLKHDQLVRVFCDRNLDPRPKGE